jgi:ribose 5-phosphate isomerase B
VRIALGADHRGFRLKERLKARLVARGHRVTDMGTDGQDSVDYPDYAARVANAVADRKAQRGILICGTGIGMSMAANRVRGVRAALCHDVRLARMSRLHNNANVLCLGGDVLAVDRANRIVDAWLRTEFEGGRHLRRVRKLDRD